MASPLAAYLKRTHLTHAEFGRRLGVTDSAVLRWAKGARKPGIELALLIERETAGAVPVASWAKKPRGRRAH